MSGRDRSFSKGHASVDTSDALARRVGAVGGDGGAGGRPDVGRHNTYAPRVDVVVVSRARTHTVERRRSSSERARTSCARTAPLTA